jgi:hypothetical protein
MIIFKIFSYKQNSQTNLNKPKIEDIQSKKFKPKKQRKKLEDKKTL